MFADIHEFVQTGRLANVAIGSERGGCHPIPWRIGRGKDHDWNMGEMMGFADELEYLQPFMTREIKIEHDEVGNFGWVFHDELHEFPSVNRYLEGVADAVFLERLADEIDVSGIIFPQ